MKKIIFEKRKKKMKVWLIRGKYNLKALKEFHEKYPIYKDDSLVDGQYLYWSRKSMFTKKETASIQTNEPSAQRAFKRAKERANKSKIKKIIDIEIVEVELILPGGD